MASLIDGYILGWNNYANNFSISLKDLLEQEQLVDVTLVADGHLFNAHRLVLSALSPYFRKMFTQMPVNQQAFVFLKDVSKETLEDLITFIYSGQVNVKQEHFDDFINTAKALDIKGLVDGGYSNSSDVQAPVFNSSTPSYNSVQYQSTRTIPVSNQTKPNLYQPIYFQPPTNTSYQHQDNFEYDYSNEANGSGNEYDDYYASDVGDGDSTTMDQDYATQCDQLNDNPKYNAEEKPTKPIKTMTKRAKTDIDASEYNTVADIRTNSKGFQNLFIGDQKFTRHQPPNGHGQQRWRCTSMTKSKCRAAASTMEVNGIVMMKNLCTEHTHG